MKIADMPAGARMDALVAEKVMGWHIGAPGVNAGFWVNADGKEMFWNFGQDAYSPSTDIAAAWLVVEKRGILSNNALEHSPHTKPACWMIGSHDYCGDYEVLAEGNTVPLTICRAALITLGVEEIPDDWD